MPVKRFLYRMLSKVRKARPVTDHPLWYAAVHEAGHAVAAVVLHGPGVVHFATMVGRAKGVVEPCVAIRSNPPIVAGWRMGKPSFLRTLSAYPERLLKAKGVASYAGAAAEFLAGVESDELRAGAELDLRRLDEFARARGAFAPASFWHGGYWHRALELVSRRWGAVVVVATALLERGFIPGWEIDEIVLWWEGRIAARLCGRDLASERQSEAHAAGRSPD